MYALPLSCPARRVVNPSSSSRHAPCQGTSRPAQSLPPSRFHEASVRPAPDPLPPPFPPPPSNKQTPSSRLTPPPQSAFAYTAVVPDGDDDAKTDDAHLRKMVTVRRLRVSTVRTDSSPSVEVVAAAADPATVASVLAHKVVSEARRRCGTGAVLRDAAPAQLNSQQHGGTPSELLLHSRRLRKACAEVHSAGSVSWTG